MVKDLVPQTFCVLVTDEAAGQFFFNLIQASVTLRGGIRQVEHF